MVHHPRTTDALAIAAAWGRPWNGSNRSERVDVSRIRVLVVDDSHQFLEGMRTLYEGDPLIRIVGVASTGMEALDMAERLRPDLVLLDVRMHPMGGLETLRLLKADPAAPVVVLTTFLGNEPECRAAMQAGADRFVEKSRIVEGLAAIARQMAGQPVGD